MKGLQGEPLLLFAASMDREVPPPWVQARKEKNFTRLLIEGFFNAFQCMNVVCSVREFTLPPKAVSISLQKTKALK